MRTCANSSSPASRVVLHKLLRMQTCAGTTQACTHSSYAASRVVLLIQARMRTCAGTDGRMYIASFDFFLYRVHDAAVVEEPFTGPEPSTVPAPGPAGQVLAPAHPTLRTSSRHVSTFVREVPALRTPSRGHAPALVPCVRPSLRRCRPPLATGTIVALALALPMALAIGYAALLVRRQLNLRGLWGLPPSVSPSFGITRRRRQMTVGGVVCKRGEGGGGAQIRGRWYSRRRGTAVTMVLRRSCGGVHSPRLHYRGQKFHLNACVLPLSRIPSTGAADCTKAYRRALPFGCAHFAEPRVPWRGYRR
jgi:hypothetical protein